MNAGICSDIFTAYDANSYINHVIRESQYHFGISNNVDNCMEHNDSGDSNEGSLASFIEYDADSGKGILP